jgi:Flp pilus assembly protein TadD
MPPLIVSRRLKLLATLYTLATLATVSGCSTTRGWESERKYGAQMARRGFWREALFRFSKAAEQNPNDAEIQNNLAVAYESLGETAKALTAYKRALELAPGDAQIKRNYARFAEYYTTAQQAASTPEAK